MYQMSLKDYKKIPHANSLSRVFRIGIFSGIFLLKTKLKVKT